MRCASFTKFFLRNPPAMITEKPHCSLDAVQLSIANVLKITCLCRWPKASCSALGQILQYRKHKSIIRKHARHSLLHSFTVRGDICTEFAFYLTTYTVLCSHINKYTPIYPFIHACIHTYVVGSISFRPDQLWKVTEMKQLCYFSI